MASPLASCVSSLRSTNALLSSSISILDSGVNDFPRLAKVLQTTRHFELLPEATLQTAQSNLLASLTPEMQNLLSKAESHLDKLQRREQALVARSELLEGRIGEERRASTGSGNHPRTSGGAYKASGGAATAVSESKESIRLKQLRRKKEGLEYAVERLNLQAQQRQRQLRKSVAAR